MDRPTVDVYEAGADHYAESRGRQAGRAAGAVAAFAERVGPDGLRADLGCGPGLHTSQLGGPVVALDAAAAMLHRLPAGVPGVRADLEDLPLRGGSLSGAWASKTYQHVSHERLPMALADLHRSLSVGAPVWLSLFTGEGTLTSDNPDDLPGRRFSLWSPEDLRAVVEGAGFDVEAMEEGEDRHLAVVATRARTLPDFVGPGLRLLVCGLNPSLYAADRGVGYARPGNRFWPAALAAGVVTRAHDPRHALRVDRVGMTDLVKRASVGAAELTGGEYRRGLDRVGRLCAWLRPQAVCLVGLAGWRAAVDRRATAGPLPDGLAGVPAYLMPNPSGLNAHVQVPELADHLRAALDLA